MNPFKPDANHQSRVSRRGLLAASAIAGAGLTAGGRLAATAGPAGVPAPSVARRSAPATPAAVAADASPQFRAVADALAEAMASHGIPGAALGLFAGGREEHAVFGVANLTTGEPVSPQTLFQVGSISKTVTGTAIMQLVAAGALDLYAPVRDYLPDLALQDASVAERVTVLHLLTHTAGWWGDAFFDTGDGDDAVARYVREVLPTLPQLAPLGMMLSYNNAAIVLLGRLVEATTGTDYRMAVRRLLLDPLAMRDSTFVPARVERGPYAIGHASTPTGTVPQSPLYFSRALDPAGGLWSTSRELMRYAKLHLADGLTPDGDRLLPAYTAQLMRRPQASLPGIANMQVGLTWFVQEFGGIRFATHDGHTFGQHASLLLAPDRQFALVLLTNAEADRGGADPAVLTTAGQVSLGLGAEAAQLGMTDGPNYAPDATPLALGPEALRQYEGRFASPDMAAVLRVADGKLLLSVEHSSLPGPAAAAVAGPPPTDVPVSVISGERLAVGSFLVGEIVRRPDADIGWLRVNILALPKVDTAE